MTEQNFSISVVVITFNRCESLRETLESLTMQTRLPNEVVVVDNNSKDKTLDVTLSFRDKLPVKYIMESKRGIPFARNTGIKNCKGDIIAFIDDDCMAIPQWLELIEKHFIRDPYIGIVGGETIFFESKDNLIGKFFREHMKKC